MQIQECLSSLHQREHSQNAFVPTAARTPMGEKTSEFAFRGDGKRAGLALCKNRLGAGTHSQRSTARLNQSRPAGMTDLPEWQAKATIPSWRAPYRGCQRQQSAQMQSWDFQVPWMLIRAAPLKAFAGRGGNSSKPHTEANDLPEWQGRATIRSWGVHIESANDRKLHKCNLGISWFCGC